MNKQSKSWRVGGTALKTLVITAVAVASVQLEPTGTVNWKTALVAGIAAVLKGLWKGVELKYVPPK